MREHTFVRLRCANRTYSLIRDELDDQGYVDMFTRIDLSMT